jgi:hypothetical protein
MADYSDDPFHRELEPLATSGVSLHMIRKTIAIEKMTNRDRRAVDKIFRRAFALLIEKTKAIN